MTDNTERTALTKMRIDIALKSGLDRTFGYFDDLHQRGINDDDVIRHLRAEGHGAIADAYIEWSGALDPDIQDDITTMSETVPDPADAPSYAEHPLGQPAPGGMIASLEKHLDSWESQGHTTVGIAFLRRHFGISK